MSWFAGESQEPAQQPVHHPRTADEVARGDLLTFKVKILPFLRAHPPNFSSAQLPVKWTHERVCSVKHWAYWIEVLTVLRPGEAPLDFSLMKDRIPFDRCAGHRHAHSIRERQRAILWPSLAHPLGSVRIHFLGDGWRDNWGVLWTPYVELTQTTVQRGHTWHESRGASNLWHSNDYVAIIRDIDRP